MKILGSQYTSYQILVLRNDTRFAHYTLGKRMLYFWLSLLLLLVACSVAGGYASWYYWNKYTARAALSKQLEKELEENRVQIERLTNLEILLQTNGVSQQNSLTGNTRQEIPPTHSDATTNATAPTTNATLSIFQGTSSTGAVASPILQTDKVKITNFVVNIIDTHRVRVSLHLHNLFTQQKLSGKLHFSLLDRNGEALEVKQEEPDSIFQIARYKKMGATFSLPATFPSALIDAVQVTVRNTEQEIIFQQIYPKAI